jgi:hypothetical protein
VEPEGTAVATQRPVTDNEAVFSIGSVPLRDLIRAFSSVESLQSTVRVRGWPPASMDVSPEEEERPPLEAT